MTARREFVLSRSLLVGGKGTGSREMEASSLVGRVIRVALERIEVSNEIMTPSE